MSGWKSWAIGEVVEADDFQTYIQNQAVQNYAGTAARTAALGTFVAEGMVSYLADTNTLQFYNGTAWENVSAPGDITAVTAGTALTGGGSSGDVTLNVNLAAVGTSVLASPNITGTATIAAGTVTGNLGVGGTAILTSGTVSGNFVVGGDLRDVGWTASRALATDASGNAVTSAVTSTELGFVSGVTSAIQTQLNARALFTQPVVSQSGNYTTVSGDANDLIYMSNAAAATVTVPDLYAVGDRIDILRDAAGTVVIAAGTGVTSWAGAGTAGTSVTFKIDQQFNAATVYKVAANTYRVVGRIIP